MTPKPTRRPRKLLLTILITLTLFLCALTTFTLTIIRNDHPIAIWLGNSAYVFQSHSYTRANHFPFDVLDAENKDIFKFGPFPPPGSEMSCGLDGPSPYLMDIDVIVLDCIP